MGRVQAIASRGKSGKHAPKVKVKILCGYMAPHMAHPCRDHRVRGKSLCQAHQDMLDKASAPNLDPPSLLSPEMRNRVTNFKHGLYTRRLGTDGGTSRPQLHSYIEAQDAVGSLDQELAVARANMAYCQGRLIEDPEGGLVTSSGANGERGWIPWQRIIQEHQHTITRLQDVQQRLIQGTGALARGALHDFLDRAKRGDTAVVEQPVKPSRKPRTK